MAFFKALIPGTLLTLVIAGILGSAHSRGGFLNIFEQTIQGHNVYWSWTLFVASFGLSWMIMTIMPD